MNREKFVIYFKEAREEIIAAFEKIDTKFERIPWQKETLGKGEMALLRSSIFEEAAVNFSQVEGDVFPGSDGVGPYFATGLSLITHMANPKMPTVHMNVRYIETPSKSWVGGGYDLTPMGFENQEDTAHFHNTAKSALGPLYSEFSLLAKDYFFIKHRGKERGVGGIFFDHWEGENKLELVQTVAKSFLGAIIPIYEKNKNLPYTPEDKRTQNLARAHYVEFNLLYDRGTKFGFNSGGNPEAILASMPPTACW